MSLKNRFTRVTSSCAVAVAAVLTLGAFSPVPPIGPDGAYSPQAGISRPSWDGASQAAARNTPQDAPEDTGLATDRVTGQIASPADRSARSPRPDRPAWNAPPWATSTRPAWSPDLQAAVPPPTPRVRSLTAGEIRTRGLDRYIDMSRQRQTAPRVIDASRGAFAGSVPTPSRRLAGSAISAGPSGCWYLTTTYGPPSMRGAAHHTWCGDGVRVTYTSAGCTGSTGVPTYLYEGCQTIEAYGVGWNIWDVTDRWRFCTSYNPYGGTCGSRIHPWQQNRYGANGQVWLLAWGD
ncbi:hypothetical protein [Streptosporangium longisporum]|uniref:Uncharacterized protein n=1 Tax=Streptosporangium longisporum TaxID=46187 RepID=A0ABP6LD87_9ACTN